MTVTNLVSEVQAHLQAVHDHPSQGLDEKLLEGIDRQVTESIQEPDRDALINQISALLPTLEQNPTPVTNLLQILISSSNPYPFSRVTSISPSVNFVAGLDASVPPINLAVLSLISKASSSKSDIGIVAGQAEIVGALVKLWLRTFDTAVASKAHEVILELLLGDDRPSDGAGLAEGGLLWRRIFRDKDIYGSVFSMCSLTTAGQQGQPSKRDKAVAQARLLDLLLCIDGDGSLIRTSQLSDVEQQYGVHTGGGLLHFAAMQMVDYRDDVLMHVTLIDFYTKFLSRKHARLQALQEISLEDHSPTSSFPLNFLQENGLHARTLKYYLDPDRQDPLNLGFLYGSSARYLSEYCSSYPGDVLCQKDFVASTSARLTKVLQSVSSGQWAQGQTPKHDLNVLASLPRATLIPRTNESPVFLIPPKSASPDTFGTLAHIFHGGEADTSPGQGPENAAARALYFFYMEHHPTFWTQIIAAAETVALKDVALAAISLISSIITAKWANLSSNPTTSSSTSEHFPLPTENQLSQSCHTSTALPSSGIEAIMSEPAVGIVVPYLMKPAQTFSNLVAGGRGDVESAAYRVAVAKHDALTLLHRALSGWIGDHPEAGEMVATVGRRVAQGPMGGSSEIGGRIGTMEL